MVSYHVVDERYHRILNPMLAEDVVLLGEVCDMKSGMRVLDMGSGKGEPALILARKYEVEVTGVDHMPEFVREARKRAKQLGLEGKCKFLQQEGEKFKIRRGAYDVVMALGTSFIYGGFEKTLETLRVGVKKRGFLVTGEPYWKRRPLPKEYLKVAEVKESDFGSDWENAEIIRRAGGELVYEIHADDRSWDRYEVLHWMAVEEWAHENPRNPQRKEFLERSRRYRELYLRWERDLLGWGVYVSRW